MRNLGVATCAGLFNLLLAGAVFAQDPPAPAAEAAPAATGDIRRDPAGKKGISPFWEAIKKGDDAFIARDIESAIAAYREALTKEPQNPMGHYRIGEAQLSKGELAEARASWETAKRFAGQDPTLKAKVLFVLADLSERERNLQESINGWNAYEGHAKVAPSAKVYPATPTDRKKRAEEWQKLETDYAAVKERIK